MVNDSTSITKVALNDTAPEALFKAVASFNKVLASETVKGGKPKATYAVNHVSNMTNCYHQQCYVPIGDDDYKLSKTGNASFRGS